MGGDSIDADPFAALAQPEASRPGARVLVLGLLGLGLFLTWQAFELRWFIALESRPPSWEQADNLEIARDYRSKLKGLTLSGLPFIAPKPGQGVAPPLYHLALAKAFTGDASASSGLWINWFYMALLAVSLFGITYSYRPLAVAACPAVIFCLSPAVHRLYHSQLAELAVAAWAAAGYWALLRSRRFTRWPASVAFGAVFAVGMLHSWSFFTYMIPGLYYCLRGLEDGDSRWKVLVSSALALALFGPWYVVNIPGILLGLSGAMSEMSMTAWKQGASFRFLADLVDDLGPLFWGLGLVGVLLPQFREDWESSWHLLAWTVTSAMFWMLIPDRPASRFLPGLPGLAVAAALSWPPRWIWILAVVQVLASVNFDAGWISSLTVNLPVADINFLVTDPPRKEDWKIVDILKEVQKRRDPDQALAAVTLVANDAHFNDSSFEQAAQILGEPRVAVRQADARLCEYSQFVVLKTGVLGPPSMIRGLAAAAQVVKTEGTWFSRSYQEAGSFPLPDGTSAVLYRRRAFKAPPFEDAAQVRYQYFTFSAGTLEVENFALDFGPWDGPRSQYQWMKIAVDKAKVKEAHLERVRLELGHVLAVPAQEGLGGKLGEDVRFLKLGWLKVNSLSMGAEDLRLMLAPSFKGWELTRLELDKTVKFSGRTKLVSFSGEASAELLERPRRLEVRVKDVKLGFTSLPAWMVDPVRRWTFSLEPTPERPFTIELAGLTLKGDRLSIP